MGVSKIITVSCDFSGCTGGQTGPAVLSWNESDVVSGKAEAPELAKYLVLFTLNGVVKSFCCQLHAAEFFLPPGYEAKQKQVVEIPQKTVEQDEKWVPKPRDATWMDEPLRSESGPVEQADGSPDEQEPA